METPGSHAGLRHSQNCETSLSTWQGVAHTGQSQWVALGLILDSDLSRPGGINQISGWRQACA
jgi:hypothetical protein